MNVFILDYDLEKSAQYYVDSHIVKIPLEIAQLLSSAVRLSRGKMIDFNPPGSKKAKHIINLLPGEEAEYDPDYDETIYTTQLAYKLSHKNHPWARWARASMQNYKTLQKILSALNDEFKYRYNHEHDHKSFTMAMNMMEPDLPLRDATPMPLCMPEHCRDHEKLIVPSYRNYYNIEKQHLATWTNREVPPWFIRKGRDDGL